MTSISAAEMHCDQCKDYRLQLQAQLRDAEDKHAQAFKKARITPEKTNL
jgi:hypothetical protein